MNFPNFSLSTILGIASAVYAALVQAFPGNPWLPIVGAALTAIGMPEKKS